MYEYYIEFNDIDGASVKASNETLAIWEMLYAHDVWRINRVTLIRRVYI